MAWVVGTYACKFENFSGQILEDRSDIDSSLGADAHLVLGVLLEETLDTTARELLGEKVSAQNHLGEPDNSRKKPESTARGWCIASRVSSSDHHGKGS